MYTVKYRVDGIDYISDRQFICPQDADSWARYLLTFGYVMLAWTVSA